MWECFYALTIIISLQSGLGYCWFLGTMEDTHMAVDFLIHPCVDVDWTALSHNAALLNAECVSGNMCFCPRVWSVRYNHSHDQLVLTASSDSRLILSNMVSISSEPFGHLVDDEELSEGEDNHQEDK